MLNIKRTVCFGLVTALTVLCAPANLAANLGAKKSVKVAEAKTVYSISVDKAELEIGGVQKLKIKRSNKKGTKNIAWKKITWKSSKKKIAKVSKYGNVKARKTGTATITGIFKKKKYTCKITVVEPEVVDTEETTEEETSTTDTVKLNTLTVDKNALNEVHSGQATWYGSDTSNGYLAGCAGLTTLVQSEKIDDGDTPLYVCALNKTDFYAGLQGAYLRVTASNGKSVDVMVTDLLPNVTPGYIDLDRKAFEVLSPLSTGRLDITWKVIKYPTKKPIQYLFKTDSTKYWAQVQVRNQSLPVVKFEYKQKGADDSTYKTLTKTYYNYYTMTSPGAGPYTFRATDILGDVLTDTISLNTSGNAISGSKNF